MLDEIECLSFKQLPYSTHKQQAATNKQNKLGLCGLKRV